MAQRREDQVDHGYAWVILFAAICNQLLTYGCCISSFALYFVEWTEYFHASKSYVASVGAVNSGCFFLVGPISTYLTKKFDGRLVIICGGIICSIGIFSSSYATSIWHLHIFYGILMGFGAGITAVPVTATVGIYFHRHRTFALAMCFAGGGFGMMLFPPLIQFLIESYTWKGSLIILAGLSLNMVVFGALLRPMTLVPPSSTSTSVSSTKSNPPSTATTAGHYAVLKLPHYWLLVTSILFWFVGALAVLMLLNDLAVVNGVSKESSALLLSANGLSNSVGRILAALIGSHSKVNIENLYNACTLLHGVATLLYVLPRPGYTLYLVFTSIFGLSYGVKLALVTAVMVNMFGIENLSVVFGFSMFVAGIGSLVGPTLTAWLFDKTGDYQLSYGFGGGMTIISVLLFLLVQLQLRREKRREELMRVEQEKNDAMTYAIVERLTVV